MPHVWQSGHCGDYPDQHDWLFETFHALEGTSGQGSPPTRFERLVEEAALETNPVVRRALYREAEMLLVDEEARMIPIFHYTTLSLTQPWVTYRTFGEPGGISYFKWQIDQAAKEAHLGG
jgi:ABC-type oligopeptide transport system substrate-binding subunit